MMSAGISEEDRARILSPPRDCTNLPGTGGRLRARLEDFRVWELPAYEADGREGAHVLCTLEKRGLTSEEALRRLSRSVGIPRGEFGLAGLKDRHAITVQWISAPHRAAPSIAEFAADDIRLGSTSPHSHKLRRGHLRGNRFQITIRSLDCDPEIAVSRAHAALARLAERGMSNYYGEQRFGRDGGNLERGLDLLRRAQRRKRADLSISAGQSALFNLYVARRIEAGLSRTVVGGDILKKTDTGGLFVCTDVEIDQARFDRGELEITAPMFGSKMREPPAGSRAAQLEGDVLARAGIERSALAALGRGVAGTRRRMRIPVDVEGVKIVDADGTSPELGPGVQLVFSLPAGSYATVLLREVMASPSGDETSGSA